MNPQYLSLLVLGAFLLSMLWKAYCIGIVWRCYKYLTLRQQSRNNTIHYILPMEGHDRLPEPDYSTLLREQEASLGILKQTPPPSYQDIMDDQPPPYPTVLVQENPQQTNIESENEEGAVAAAAAPIAQNAESTRLDNEEKVEKEVDDVKLSNDAK